MSGHSKWSNIKRKKAINDAKRSKIFSKMSRLISVATREGGGSDPDSNPKLRLAIDKARYYRMPKENIGRAIQKGLGQGGEKAYQETVYEGFGPNGEAFYIKALTDNLNRTVSEIRVLFTRYGGSLGGAGSTAYIFVDDPEKPTFKVNPSKEDLNKLVHLYEDLDDHDDVQEIYVNFDIEL